MSERPVSLPALDDVPDVPIHSADLTLALQSELAALADIEAEFAAKRQQLETWSGPVKMKEWIVREVEARHRRKREPHVLRLGELYERITNLTLFRNLRTKH